MSNKKADSKPQSRYPVNLPDTPFPMRGDLPKREPGWVKEWQERRLYQRLRDARHGPPEVRAARRPAVRQRPDPHGPRGQQDPEGHDRQGAPAGRLRRALRAGLGLPRPADRERRSRRSTAATCRRDEVQAKSRAYATEQIAQQMADFKRLGVLGDWDHPYRTMDFAQRGRRDPRVQARDRARLRLPRPEAGVLVLRLRLVAGRVRDRVRGQEDRDASTSRFSAAEPAKLAAAFGLPALPRKDAFAVIWTTTPWTIPANQALNLQPGARLRAGRHRARPADAGRRRWSRSA